MRSPPTVRAMAVLLGAASTGAFAAAAPPVSAVGEPSLAPTVVRSLHYGDVLFHFYQGDDFNGIVRQTAFRDQGHLAPHRDDADLLLGGMYLSFGQYRQAEDLFNRLLDRPSTPEPVRARAWFLLGKVLHERGQWSRSEQALRRAGDGLPAELAAERQLLIAQDLMQLGRFDDAILHLRAWAGPPAWMAYARFNLGVALIRSGRLDDGLRVLEDVGGADADGEEMRALRDKANVAAGYALLQADRPAEAAAVIARVRLSGASSNRALLGAGWAAAAQGDYRAALAPWMELSRRNGLDAAVQEARLAVPDALAKLGADAAAVTDYEAAITAFDAETARLDESIGAIRAGRLLERVAERAGDGPRGWYRQLTDLPDSPESRYLYLLMAGNEFQQGLRNYHTLAFLHRNLATSQASLSAFRDMVETRRRSFAARLPAASDALGRLDLQDVERRRDRLQSRLEQARRERDSVALGGSEDLARWARIQAAQQELDLRPDDESLDEARDKLRLARGTVLWKLDAEYKLRSHDARRSLRALSAEVSELRRRIAATAAVRNDVPGANDAFLMRIDALEPRITAMLAAVRSAQDEQARFLADLAVDELRLQQRRLADYRSQARYALATIYDRASQAAGSTP
jgi:hypothetical protein